MESFRRLFEILDGGERAVLATVVETKGSTPRETGAKMIVCENGAIFGTIGGGAGEAKVIRAAKTVFQTGEKQAIEIDLTKAAAEGVCGGKMRIWLELWRGETALNLVKQILENLANGRTVCFITPFEQEIKPHLSANKESETENAFVEILKPTPTLFIVGAGHVAVELAKIGSLIGFEIIVQDDRKEWANRINFPAAKEIFNDEIETAIEKIADLSELYIALLTRGFAYDLKGLETIFRGNLNWNYLGMIGSERRVRTVFREMKNIGFSQIELKRINAPIGLKIGALTPAEIAVSIAAELITVRRKAEQLSDCK